MNRLRTSTEMLIEVESDTETLATALAERWPPVELPNGRWLQSGTVIADMQSLSSLENYWYDPNVLTELVRYALDMTAEETLPILGLDFIEVVSGVEEVSDDFSLLRQ